jgi:hypothetical protein
MREGEVDLKISRTMCIYLFYILWYVHHFVLTRINFQLNMDKLIQLQVM